MEEHCLTKEKAAVEVEERWRAEEAEACWFAGERAAVAVVARQQAILDMEAKQRAEAEEMCMEQGGGITIEAEGEGRGQADHVQPLHDTGG